MEKFTVISQVYVGMGHYLVQMKRVEKLPNESMEEMLKREGIDDPQFIFLGHPELEGEKAVAV